MTMIMVGTGRPGAVSRCFTDRGITPLLKRAAWPAENVNFILEGAEDQG